MILVNYMIWQIKLSILKIKNSSPFDYTRHISTMLFFEKFIINKIEIILKPIIYIGHPIDSLSIFTIPFIYEVKIY